MRILKVISLLLDYPTQILVDGHDELEKAIIESREISPKQRGALFELLELICSNDLMDGQEHYGALFGRGRSLSLLLFEHVHGESRDRGQAMVDMMAQYQEAGFAIGVKELPDYIPLYLEFLSTREDIEAREGLADVAHLLALLAARLEHPAPDYQAIYAEHFDCALHFDARDNAFAFDKRWLDHPLPLADTITHQAMAERCRKQNLEFTGRQAWLGRIRQLLRAQLNAAPGLEGLAQQMNCSARTLRRHLKELGCSYQELLDELRFEQAKHMLCEDQMPIYRIAEALGFSETASFRHAFVRWSGVAPSQFRP